MLGLHIEQPSTTETVTFAEDGVVASFDVSTIRPFDDYLLSANDTLLNDVKGFLSRPVTIGNIVWNKTDAIGADLFEPDTTAPTNSGYDLPDDWLTIPMIAEKLKGFAFLRCSFKIRVQFNAQPFNAGRVLIYFLPFADSFSHELNPQITSTTHFGGVTGYRHVDLDLSTATSAEITIPYIGLLSHFNLIHNRSSFGRVRCVVYSQLTSGASELETAVDGTVWAHAEDIDIQLPTGVDQLTRRVTAQSNNLNKTLGKSGAKTSGTQKEKEEPAKGSIETLMNTTSKIAEFAGRIPGIAELANGVRWAADIAAGVAGIFGWSKPIDPSFTTLTQMTYNRNMTNFNGDAKSKPLGLDARNEVVVPTFAYTTDDDEMSLAAVLSRPVYIDRFSMTKDNGVNSTLWRWPVTPSACTKTTAVSPYPAGVLFHHTFLSYVARLFKFWRGTINYHFKIVKTSFHSGRIRVFFVPLADLSTNVAHIDLNKCYNKIYDIRDTAEFDFAIPFVSNTVWRELNPAIAASPLDLTSDVPSGMIYVQVLNQLRNPSIAADDIEFLVETSAGTDFQFAFLTQNTQVKPMRITHENFMNIVADDKHRQTRRVKAECDDFFETHKMQDVNPNMLGIGEAVTSFRQMLKRYGRFAQTLPKVADEAHLNVVRPYDTNDCFGNVSVSNDQSGPCDGLFDYISYLYRMQSGGMRLMIVAKDPDSTSVDFYLRPYSLVPHPEPLSTFYETVLATTWPEASTSLPYVKFFPVLENTLEVEIPFYQPYPVQMSNLGQPSPSDAFTEGTEQPYNYGTQIALNNFCDCEVFRSIGEDFNFGYIVGPPMGLYVNPTPSTF